MYTCEDTKRNYGFLVINFNYDTLNNSPFIQFALINLPTKSNISIEDFKSSGYLYTKMIPNRRKGTEALGIYTYDFDKNSYFLLNKFKAIGELKLNKNKFIIGSGGSAPFIEKSFIMYFKNIDLIQQSYDKTPLAKILN